MNSEQLCALVIEALEAVKAKDIVKLDVRNLTTVTDYMTCTRASCRSSSTHSLPSSPSMPAGRWPA